MLALYFQSMPGSDYSGTTYGRDVKGVGSLYQALETLNCRYGTSKTLRRIYTGNGVCHLHYVDLGGGGNHRLMFA